MRVPSVSRVPEWEATRASMEAVSVRQAVTAVV